MRYLYLFLFIVLLSCEYTEKERLLVVQNEYIEELKVKKKNIDAAISSRYRNGSLKLDSINTFANVSDKFYLVLEKSDGKTISNYIQSKTFLTSKFGRKERQLLLNPNNFDRLLVQSTKSSKSFELELLQDYNTFTELFLNNTGSITCGFNSDYIVHTDLNNISNKKIFLKDGRIFLSKRVFQGCLFDRIYFGKLDMNQLNKEKSISDQYYQTADSNNIKMSILETHNFDTFKDNYFLVKNLEMEILNDTLEGMFRVETNRSFYTFIPFRYTFTE